MLRGEILLLLAAAEWAVGNMEADSFHSAWDYDEKLERGDFSYGRGKTFSV